MIRLLTRIKKWIGITLNKSEQDYWLLKPIASSLFFNVTQKDKEQVGLSFNKEFKLFARTYPHSDLIVLNQVLIDEEYQPVIRFLKDNFSQVRKLKIIDAGANVGYTTVYFLYNFPEAHIICVEPDNDNMNLLNKNLESFIHRKKVIAYKMALHGQSDRNMVIMNGFRDGKDWAIRVEEAEEQTELKSISVGQIIKENEWDVVDVLKIDIEGAERFLFEEGADLDYLEIVRLLAMEIHDEFNIREKIYSRLKKYDFIILNLGETILAVNSRFIDKPVYESQFPAHIDV